MTPSGVEAGSSPSGPGASARATRPGQVQNRCGEGRPRGRPSFVRGRRSRAIGRRRRRRRAGGVLERLHPLLEVGDLLVGALGVLARPWRRRPRPCARRSCSFDTSADCGRSSSRPSSASIWPLERPARPRVDLLLRGVPALLGGVVARGVEQGDQADGGCRDGPDAGHDHPAAQGAQVGLRWPGRVRSRRRGGGPRLARSGRDEVLLPRLRDHRRGHVDEDRGAGRLGPAPGHHVGLPGQPVALAPVARARSRSRCCPSPSRRPSSAGSRGRR